MCTWSVPMTITPPTICRARSTLRLFSVSRHTGNRFRSVMEPRSGSRCPQNSATRAQSGSTGSSSRTEKREGIGKSRDMIGSQGSEAGIRRRVNALLLAAWLLFFAAGCAGAGCAGAGGEMVIVTQKTRTYHREECPRVKMADVKVMTRDEALALNCQPCPDCRPDARK